MPATLSPRAGFDWLLIRWGGPEELRTEVCSYVPCGKPLGEDEIPLSLFRDDGSVAEFCEDCQRKWWGAEIFKDEPEVG
ncbi:MAG TPA: hypothetical protein VLS49_13435 [Usitatibacter sp.]|nr:hypothetical protein [Usitatibacter sp.]